MTARTLKVGAAQFASEIGDVDANMGRHLDWIARGHEAGLDLLVLPELSLTGHHGGEMAVDCAMKRSDPRLSGTIAQSETPGSRPPSGQRVLAVP